MDQKCIGVDIGGTSVKLGLFQGDGTLLRKWEIPTRKENGGAYILEDIAASIRRQLSEEGLALSDLEGAGMGLPGPVLPDGHIEFCVNLGWKAGNPQETLSGLLDGLPVKSGNKDIPAVAFTHTPYLDFLLDPAKYYSCLTPIHLNGFGWVIGQWYKHIAHLAFEFCHRPSYRSFTAIKTTFGNQACVYLMCCMLLLSRRFLVRIQALHDKCFDFIGDDVIFSAAARFAFPWNCSSFPVFLYCVS